MRTLRRLSTIFFIALVIVFGGHLARVFFPSVGWYLRDTVRLDILALIPYALGPFLLALPIILLSQLLKLRHTLLLWGILLGIVRIAEQISTEPALDLWFSMTGILLFLVLLPFLLNVGAKPFRAGFLLGLAFDATLKAISGTLDLSWIAGLWPTVLVVVLVAVSVLLLWWASREADVAVAPPKPGYWSLLGFGPLLFLYWLILNNQGWVMTLTAWSAGGALLLILLGHLGAMWLMAQEAWLRPPSYRLAAAALFFILMVWLIRLPASFAFLFLPASWSAGVLLALITGESAADGARRAGAILLWFSLLLFGILVLLYYMALELPLPFRQLDIAIFGALAAAVTAMAGVILRRKALTGGENATPAVLAPLALLLVVPLLLLAQQSLRTTAAAPAPSSLTVMTYNLHSGFGTAGRQSIAESAAVIDAAGADVVGLQEVSRGWLLDGGVDLVDWLSQELNMPYVAFVSTIDDPLWGNAVLSRYPIEDIDTGLLPAMGTLIGRGYVAATIDTGGAQPLHFISTHLHHRADDLEALHIAQVTSLLEGWDGRPRTILVGDMNARPGWPQMEMIQEAGFLDAWLAGTGPGYTANAADPRYRIDWIFHTPDLEAVSAAVRESQSSDHFAVVATIEDAPVREPE